MKDIIPVNCGISSVDFLKYVVRDETFIEIYEEYCKSTRKNRGYYRQLKMSSKRALVEHNILELSKFIKDNYRLTLTKKK